MEPGTAQPLPPSRRPALQRTSRCHSRAHRAAYVDDAGGAPPAAAGWARRTGARSRSTTAATPSATSRRCAARRRRLARVRRRFPARNAAGWTPFREAVSAGDERTARLIFDLQEVANPVLPKCHLPEEGLRALRSMPDFTMKIKWRVRLAAPRRSSSRGTRRGHVHRVEARRTAAHRWHAPRRRASASAQFRRGAAAPSRCWCRRRRRRAQTAVPDQPQARRYASASFKKAVTKEGGFHGAPKPARLRHADRAAAARSASTPAPPLVTTDCAITVEPPTAADGRFPTTASCAASSRATR